MTSTKDETISGRGVPADGNGQAVGLAPVLQDGTPRLNHPKDETPTEKRTCQNCGNSPDVPVGLVVICCPVCGGRFSSSVKEWE